MQPASLEQSTCFLFSDTMFSVSLPVCCLRHVYHHYQVYMSFVNNELQIIVENFDMHKFL